jgi:hypothetical protein
MSDGKEEELRIRSENRKLKTEVRGLVAENRVLKGRLGRLLEFESMFPRCYFGKCEVIPVGYNPSVAAAVGNSGHGDIPDEGKCMATKQQQKNEKSTSEPKQIITEGAVVPAGHNPHNIMAVVPAGYNRQIEIVEIDDSSNDGDDAPEIVNGIDRKRNATKKRKMRN